MSTLGDLGIPLIDDGQRMAVEFALRALPLVYHSEPIVHAVRAYLHAANGNVQVAASEMKEVTEQPLPPSLESTIRFRYADLLIRRHDGTAAYDCVAPYLTDEDMGTRTEAIVNAALALSMQHGKAEEARAHLSRAATLIDVVPTEIRGRLYAPIANTEALLGNHPEAERFGLLAVEFASQSETKSSCARVLNALLVRDVHVRR